MNSIPFPSSSIPSSPSSPLSPPSSSLSSFLDFPYPPSFTDSPNFSPYALDLESFCFTASTTVYEDEEVYRRARMWSFASDDEWFEMGREEYV